MWFKIGIETLNSVLSAIATFPAKITLMRRKSHKQRNCLTLHLGLETLVRSRVPLSFELIALQQHYKYLDRSFHIGDLCNTFAQLVQSGVSHAQSDLAYKLVLVWVNFDHLAQSLLTTCQFCVLDENYVLNLQVSSAVVPLLSDLEIHQIPLSPSCPKFI